MAQQKPNPKAFGKPSGVCTVYPATHSLYISISPLDSYPYTPAIPGVYIEFNDCSDTDTESSLSMLPSQLSQWLSFFVPIVSVQSAQRDKTPRLKLQQDPAFSDLCHQREKMSRGCNKLWRRVEPRTAGRANDDLEAWSDMSAPSDDILYSHYYPMVDVSLWYQFV